MHAHGTGREKMEGIILLLFLPNIVCAELIDSVLIQCNENYVRVCSFDVAEYFLFENILIFLIFNINILKLLKNMC